MNRQSNQPSGLSRGNDTNRSLFGFGGNNRGSNTSSNRNSGSNTDDRRELRPF